jgi:hypothetical protein
MDWWIPFAFLACFFGALGITAYALFRGHRK